MGAPREIRERLGLTLKELAPLVEIDNPNNIRRIESGLRKPPVRYIALLEALAAGYRPKGWPKKNRTRY